MRSMNSWNDPRNQPKKHHLRNKSKKAQAQRSSLFDDDAGDRRRPGWHDSTALDTEAAWKNKMRTWKEEKRTEMVERTQLKNATKLLSKLQIQNAFHSGNGAGGYYIDQIWGGGSSGNSPDQMFEALYPVPPRVSAIPNQLTSQQPKVYRLPPLVAPSSGMAQLSLPQQPHYQNTLPQPFLGYGLSSHQQPAAANTYAYPPPAPTIPQPSHHQSNYNNHSKDRRLLPPIAGTVAIQTYDTPPGMLASDHQARQTVTKSLLGDFQAAHSMTKSNQEYKDPKLIEEFILESNSATELPHSTSNKPKLPLGAGTISYPASVASDGTASSPSLKNRLLSDQLHTVCALESKRRELLGISEMEQFHQICLVMTLQRVEVQLRQKLVGQEAIEREHFFMLLLHFFTTHNITLSTPSISGSSFIDPLILNSTTATSTTATAITTSSTLVNTTTKVSSSSPAMAATSTTSMKSEKGVEKKEPESPSPTKGARPQLKVQVALAAAMGRESPRASPMSPTGPFRGVVGSPRMKEIVMVEELVSKESLRGGNRSASPLNSSVPTSPISVASAGSASVPGSAAVPAGSGSGGGGNSSPGSPPGRGIWRKAGSAVNKERQKVIQTLKEREAHALALLQDLMPTEAHDRKLLLM